MIGKENKKICSCLKTFDLFSTPFNFTYKRKEDYSTRKGGFITILYLSIALGYLIYKFIYFIKRDKYELVYLEENMDSTDIP